MDYYYIIVSAVATIILVLILTYVGILMTSTQKKATYPPSYNLCPDYWQSNGSGTCNIPTTGMNAPSSTDWVGDVYGYTDGDTAINFSDPGWSGGSTGEQRCGWQKWANANEIQWDGVTNYNGC
jgi:hypothetical protein